MTNRAKTGKSKRRTIVIKISREGEAMESARSIAGYNVKNPLEVLSFLLWHPYLIKTVLEAPQEIKKVFGDVVPTIEVYRDYEYPKWQALLVKVSVSGEVDDAIAKLDKLGEDWFSCKSNLGMSIDVDFVGE